MAHIEDRGNAWLAVVRLPDGKKISATRDTKGEAEAWGNAQERLKTLGTLKATKVFSLTVGKMFEAYENADASKTDSAKWNLLRIHKRYLDPISKLRTTEILTHDINE